jgi:DNA-binding transcriptional ArsR family regulator
MSGMTRRKESVTLTDPRALRAIAHPARQRLVNELFDGRVLTATEAADLVGLTPSAVSHHLRALEKWGLARRAKPTRDGRERPWEGTARTLNLRPTPQPGSRLAMQAVVGVQIDAFSEQLMRYLARVEHEGPRWPGQGMTRGELWLTEDETRELLRRVDEAIDDLGKGRSAHRHPRDARKLTFTWSLIPSEDDPQP